MVAWDKSLPLLGTNLQETLSCNQWNLGISINWDKKKLPFWLSKHEQLRKLE